jgi:hypothetical protein
MEPEQFADKSERFCVDSRQLGSYAVVVVISPLHQQHAVARGYVNNRSAQKQLANKDQSARRRARCYITLPNGSR